MIVCSCFCCGTQHGWKTGEHRLYAKHTQFELDARVTMIVRVPWKNQSVGKYTESITELQDLYPTIVSLLGLPKPKQTIDGDDVSAVFDDPTTMAKPYAYSQYDRCPEPDEPVYFHPNCEEVTSANISVMGYGVRDTDYRLTQWYKWDGATLKADFAAGPMATELYDHRGDTGLGDWEQWENENIADDPAHKQDLARLQAALIAHYDSSFDDHVDDDFNDDHQ